MGSVHKGCFYKSKRTWQDRFLIEKHLKKMMCLKDSLSLSCPWRLENLIYSFCSKVFHPDISFDMVFILSHMRSGSSLISHLLFSNPDILGYGETQLRYTRPQHLAALRGKVLWKMRNVHRPRNEKYILEKILHNHLLRPENIDVLSDKKHHIIFLMRHHLETVISLMESLDLTEEYAVGYYVNRLETLERFAKELSRVKPCLFLTYDQLLHQTRKTFRLLESFLKLREPLSEQYQVLPTTGRKGVGDISQYILKGAIIRKSSKADDASVSKEAVRKSLDAFERCYATLHKKCLSL